MKTLFYSIALLLPLGIVGCGGSSDSDSSSGSSSDSVTYKGTVPGTLIEAFCDNGAYYSTNSIDDGTSQHPFELKLPAGLACNLVMTTNENDPANSVVTPIGFIDQNGHVSTRVTGPDGTEIDLGNIPLYVSRDDAGGDDADDDGILDAPMDLGKPAGLIIELYSNSSTWDEDGDGVINYYDDEDDDGTPNHDDPDYSKADTDGDADGLDDDVDVNPDNDSSHSNEYPISKDHDRDGYLDEDQDHDGYYDDDSDQDGFHDDDLDEDGFHDDDLDEDGFHDDDLDEDGFHDDDLDHDGEHDDN